MKAPTRFLLVLTAVLLAFSVFGMLTINAKIARSATNTNSSNSTASGSSPEAAQTFASAARKVCFHVNDRVGLASTLSWEIREALRAKNRFDIYLVNNEPGKDDHPLLLASIENPKIFWTPFYCHATFDVKYVYATDTTDPKLLQGASDEFEPGSLPEKFQLRVRGTISVTDTTMGIVTLPAYRKHLVEDPAKTIVEAMTKALDDLEKKVNEKPEGSGTS
ncbi:MAG: hypothetical protein WC655_30010 [Candidatus Hydrogenedentales bacterium]|jgi:hypothetical protein